MSLCGISFASFLPISEKYLLNSLAISLSPAIDFPLTLTSFIVVALDCLFNNSFIVRQLSLLFVLVANLEL